MPKASEGFERVAHRGSPRERRENTLPSFLVALEHGADAIELDVHVTKDHVVVVHHDPTVGGRAIADSRWRDLANLDLGGGVAMPRLEDVFEAVRDRAIIYVELKGAQIEDDVIRVARTHGQRYAFHSFDHDAMARVAERASDIPRGVLLDKDIASPVEDMRRAVRRTRPRDVWPHWSLVDDAFIRAAQELGVRVIAWTVNSTESARQLASLGVAGICSDDVRLLANLS